MSAAPRSSARLLQRSSTPGGVVIYDYQIDADGEYKDNPDLWAPRWLRRAVGDEWFQDVIHVDLRDIQPTKTRLGEDTLAAVATLGRLEKLEIDLPRYDGHQWPASPV